MSNNNSQTTMLVVVGIVGCCCLASAVTGVYLYMNPDKWEWVKDTFGFGDSTEAGTEPVADAPVDDTTSTV